MHIKKEADLLIKNSDTSCLVSLPQGEGLVYIVTHTSAGEQQSVSPTNRKDIFISADSTMTQNNSSLSSIEKTLAE